MKPKYIILGWNNRYDPSPRFENHDIVGYARTKKAAQRIMEANSWLGNGRYYKLAYIERKDYIGSE